MPPTKTAPRQSVPPAFPWKAERFDPADPRLATTFPSPEIIESRKLIAVDVLKNANKFYNVYLERAVRTATTGTGKTYPVFRVRVEFGRVGTTPQQFVFVPGVTRAKAKEVFDAKVLEKTTPGRTTPDGQPGDVYADAGPVVTGTGATISPVVAAGKTAQVAVVPAAPGTGLVPATPKLTVVPATQAQQHTAPATWDAAARRFYDTLLKEARTAIATGMQVSKVASGGLVTPLGVIDDGRLQEALDVLRAIELAIKNMDIRQVLLLNERFFKLIPTATGQKVLDALLTTPVEVDAERQVLEQALAVIGAQGSVSTGPVRLDPVTPAELGDLTSLLRANPCTCSSHVAEMRKLAPTQAFRVTRPAERAALKALLTTRPAYRAKFVDAATGKLQNLPLLLHGSRRENAIGILTRGLLPRSESGVTNGGSVYGPGIYAANNAGKALGYTGYASTGQRVLFVLFGAMATPFIHDGRVSGSFDRKRAGRTDTDGVWARADGGLIHDEWIFDRAEQVALAYVMTV